MRAILAGAAVVALVSGIFLIHPGLVATADDWACDLVTGLVSPGKPSGKVAIVEIDETSLAQFGRWPWPTDFLASVVRHILDDGAAVVVLDTVLTAEDHGTPSVRPPGGPKGLVAGTNDDVLAAVLQGHPVVPGYAFEFDGSGSNPSACALRPLPVAIMSPGESLRTALFHASGAICTVPQISRSAADTGFLNAAPDSDGKLRRVPLVMEYGDKEYPSLALAAYDVYRGASASGPGAGPGAMQLNVGAREASSLRLGPQVVRLEGPGLMRLRFRGAQRTFPYVSVVDVLNDRLPAGTLRGKIAILGGSALGLPNPLATPLDAQFPDVEVQATALDNLIEGDSFQKPGGFLFWESLLALLAGLGATFLLALVRVGWSAWIVFGIAAAMWVGSAALLSTAGLLFSPLPVTAALVCNLPIVTLLNSRKDKQRAERMKLQLASEREHSREVLRDSESRYQRLVENINDAIIVDDPDGRLVFANRRFREWFALEGREIREVSPEDCIAPEWREKLRDQRIRRMSGESVPDHYEYEGIRHDGKRIWIEALVTNVEEDGRILGTQSALRDVTERKQIEAQYLQAQKMESIGRLAGGVAHDFNNLLTVINGFSDLLLSQRPSDNEYRTLLKEIRAAGERAAEVTRNLLIFSRKRLAQSMPVDLNQVITEALRMVGQLIGEDVELVTRLSPSLGEVQADSGQLHQILMNLLVNARDAMPDGGKIVIETENVEADANFARVHPGSTTGSWVYLAVTDTGTGINDEVRQHLFEPFFTTKDPGKGTGLGLATIYGIVQQCGGTIEVTSEPDAGTTFHIYLPKIISERPAELHAKDSAPDTQGSGTILVVEDEDAVRRYLCAVLKEAGYNVLQAANGPDALALAEQFEGWIDLLVTDLVMPLMNGRELAEKLSIARPHLKVLFISGYEDGSGIVADELAWLPKPFNSGKLTSMVREVLENREEPPAASMRGGI